MGFLAGDFDLSGEKENMIFIDMNSGFSFHFLKIKRKEKI